MIKKFSFLPLISRVLIIAMPIIYAVGAFVLYYTFGEELKELLSNKESFRVWISSFGKYEEIIFVSIRAIQTVIKIVPAEPLEIGAGYIWGTYKGMALCILGTEIGSAVILLITSIFGTKVLSVLFDLNKINEWSFIKNSKKKYLLLTIIYLIPGTPKDFITYIVGISKTKILPFLLITGIARIPSIISSTWCGSILEKRSIMEFSLVFGLITIASLLIGYIFKKKISIKKGHSDRL